MFPRALRMQTLLRGAGAALSTLVLAGAALAAPTRHTLGPDASGVGRVLTTLGADGSPTEQFALGDGSVAYNGLSYRASDDRFYAVASDSLGGSSLVSFAGSGAGSVVTIGVLDTGVVGMAFNAADDNFYAAATSPFGESSLLRITTGGVSTTVGSLGLGFMGGLAFGPGSSTLYGMSGDAFGVQRVVNQIDTGTGSATALFELGDGSLNFNGGLAFNGATGQFEIIGSDFFGLSSLYSFSTSGASSLAHVGAIGPGFMNAGLVLAAPPVPELATWVLMLVALAAIAVARRAAGGGARH
jgi:hypothetical protein